MNANEKEEHQAMEADEEVENFVVTPTPKAPPPPPLLKAIGAPYAQNLSFWSGVLLAGVLQGVVLGLAALAIFLAFVNLQEATWNQGDYKQALDVSAASTTTATNGTDTALPENYNTTLDLGSGEWWYVGMLAAGGAAIGLVKVLWTMLVHPFPAKPAGFLADVQTLASDEPWESIPIVICAIISIGCGASVGPEMPLGALAVAVGGSALPWLSRSITNRLPSPDSFLFRFLDLRGQEKLCALDGLAAAYGPLLPSQFLASILLHECGYHWGGGNDEHGHNWNFMETVTRTGVASTIGYLVFVGLEQETILETLPLPEAGYDVLQTIDLMNILQAAILGVICGIIGLVGFILMVVMAKIGDAVCGLIDRLGIGIFSESHETSPNPNPPRSYLGMMVTPTIGGALVGLLAVACPLTLGDGSDQLTVILVNPEALGIQTLIVSAFVKLLAMATSLGFGFIGGQIFPFLFAGACVGSVAHLLVPDVPILISYSACLTAMPSAFLPTPFTLTTLTAMSMALGAPVTSAVFVAAICSFTVVCGAGIIQGMVEKALAKKQQ